MTQNIRNIAIIAHVDHGKTTLVDQLLRQSGTLDERKQPEDRVMDSNDLERERGITILSKNTAIRWNEYHINIVDTPGHADFGGEVERVLSMVDSVLLLVDAQEGPMPQTRFVTEKALRRGLKPIVVINKVDKDGARPDWVVDQTFDLFDQLGACDEQLDFPIIYASGINGIAGYDADELEPDMQPIFATIVEKVPAPEVELNGPFQMQVSSLSYDTFKGVMGTGRITRGTIKTGQAVKILDREGHPRSGKVQEIFGFHGLEKEAKETANAGEIVVVSGLGDLDISDTICDPNQLEILPVLSVEEPTISMTFQVNTSPFVGQDGKFLTSRQIRDRLDQELKTNVALKVDTGEDPDKFKVSGRGELHLGILLENMRREGFELGVSRPEVVLKNINGVIHEPFENLTVDVEEEHQGSVIDKLQQRKAEMTNMMPDGKGRIRIDFEIPSRGLIGFRTEFLTTTQGSGLMYNTFLEYRPQVKGDIGQRLNGVLISNGQGKALGYALFNLQERGKMMIDANTQVYEGMLIGIHSRDNDLVVNCLKGKQLTNVRAAGTDENIALVPPVKHTLEQALEFIDDDELVEVTPNNIRLRKKILLESDRKRAGRQGK